MAFIIEDGILISYEPEAGETELTIPKSVTHIGNHAFYECESLTAVTIPYSVRSIGAYAFAACKKLKSVKSPESVKSIGAYAFYECICLTSANIPDGIMSISDYTFASCFKLTSLTIPDSVKRIGKCAVNFCESITSIAIPDSVTSIGQGAFGFCKGLISIVIPESITSIEEGSFHHCENLIRVSIPESVTSIGVHAFLGCHNLSSVTIPDSVTYIGKEAFLFCDDLTIHTSAGSYAARYCLINDIEVDDDVEEPQIVENNADLDFEQGNHSYEENEEDNVADEYVGKEVPIEVLVGRNYYSFTEGKKDARQPLELVITDIDLGLEEEHEEDDEEYDDDDYEKYEDDEEDGLADYLPEKCWVKRISAKDDGYEAYYLLAVSLDESDNIKETSVILEEVSKMGGGWFIIPGMEQPGFRSFEELDYFPDEVIDELRALTNGRCLRNGFSFMGKKLPAKLMNGCRNGRDKTNFIFAMQSAYRTAYTHLSIDADQDGIITDFEYSSYQSNGSACGDMFSRPIGVRDRKEEALDMLLYIVDSYSDEEYQTIVS